jgi:hypothetical protein
LGNVLEHVPADDKRRLLTHNLRTEHVLDQDYAPVGHGPVAVEGGIDAEPAQAGDRSAQDMEESTVTAAHVDDKAPGKVVALVEVRGDLLVVSVHHR